MKIATARIHGLESSPYWFGEHCHFAWDITFSEHSEFFAFINIVGINMGKTKEEAEEFCDGIKENFKQANIHENDEVTVVYGRDGLVIAIGKKEEKSWIEVNNKFSKRSFEAIERKYRYL